MPFIDTNEIEPWERLPGWRGRTFDSPSMSFSHWEFDEGSSIHEHHHEQEEVWHVVKGELEVTIDGETCLAGQGMVAIIPSNAKHHVLALSDGIVIVVDYPLRPDENPETR